MSVTCEEGSRKVVRQYATNGGMIAIPSRIVRDWEPGNRASIENRSLEAIWQIAASSNFAFPGSALMGYARAAGQQPRIPAAGRILNEGFSDC